MATVDRSYRPTEGSILVQRRHRSFRPMELLFVESGPLGSFLIYLLNLVSSRGGFNQVLVGLFLSSKFSYLVFAKILSIVLAKWFLQGKGVLRLWKVPAFLNPSEFSSIEMVLVDEKVSVSYCHLANVHTYVRRITMFEIYATDVRYDGNQLWVIKFRGRAFLWHQVRCMVAGLFLIGKGKSVPQLQSSEL
ncbi:hypothetical protein TSUD_409270 [Trifolium subterraneum]|uniref:tRNA pseudouridine synthase n=1 Tax=Trifolium subterraneum TaxID=3900 RepID=A0A2Z6PIK5_TRISU|nr:hypothetical protein TSUD_409270 [Trifolium subterraneum]